MSMKISMGLWCLLQMLQLESVVKRALACKNKSLATTHRAYNWSSLRQIFTNGQFNHCVFVNIIYGYNLHSGKSGKSI